MPVFALDDDRYLFPDPSLAEPDGLLAVGGDLSPQRLLLAYEQGIFPWYSGDSPILWWSPDPRCVLFPQEFHMPRSLQKYIRKNIFTCTMNKAFPEVIASCARRGEDTWLLPEMIDAYVQLHRLGIAWSLETWRDETLVGGLYGIGLGRAFFGESMFFSEPNASKVALVALVDFALQNNISFIDCQQTTDNLLRFGAREIPRAEFLQLLRQAR